MDGFYFSSEVCYHITMPTPNGYFFHQGGGIWSFSEEWSANEGEYTDLTKIKCEGTDEVFFRLCLESLKDVPVHIENHDESNEGLYLRVTFEGGSSGVTEEILKEHFLNLANFFIKANAMISREERGVGYYAHRLLWVLPQELYLAAREGVNVVGQSASTGQEGLLDD